VVSNACWTTCGFGSFAAIVHRYQQRWSITPTRDICRRVEPTTTCFDGQQTRKSDRAAELSPTENVNRENGRIVSELENERRPSGTYHRTARCWSSVGVPCCCVPDDREYAACRVWPSRRRNGRTTPRRLCVVIDSGFGRISF